MLHMTSLDRKILAGVLLFSIYLFGYMMNHMGTVTNPHQLSIQYYPDNVTIMQDGTESYLSQDSVPVDGYQNVLQRVIDLMNTNPRYQLTAVVHTDIHKDPTITKAISNGRAQILETYFKASNIDLSRVLIQSVGSTDPLPRGTFETDTQWQRRLNRTDLYLVMK